jgi:hypothetical protein
MALARCKLQQPIKALQHFADVEGRGERPLARHVLIEVRDVGGEHDNVPS